MKFDHAVKYNGKYYPAGAEIPEPEPEVKTEPEQKVTKVRKKGDA